MNWRQRTYSLFRLCLKPRMTLLVQTLAVVCVFNALDLFLPKLLQLFVDSLDAENRLSLWGLDLQALKTHQARFLWFPLFLLVLALVRWLFTYLRGVCQARLGQGAMLDLRNRIYDQVQSLSFSYHDREHSGRLISNLVEDIGTVQRFFERACMALLEVLFGFIFIYLYMFSVCWPAALTSATMLSLALMAGLVYMRYGYPYFQRRRQRFEEVVTTFSETMEGHLVVRAFGRIAALRERYNQQVKDLHKAHFTEIFLFSILNQTYLISVVLGVTVVAAVMILLIRNGWSITSGEFFVVLYLQNFTIMRMRWLSRVTDQMMRFSVAAERLQGVLDATEYLSDQGEPSVAVNRCDSDTTPCCMEGSPSPVGGSIRLENVSFGYGDSPHSLHNISMTIEEGSTVGLVGTTGSGKTTLALLLCRFYDPDSGQLYLGSQEAGQIPLSALRREFALVFQDTFLFSASIRDNIAYGKPCATADDVVHVATLAHAHDFIMQFPDGYETKVGERGVTLSGGQRQRVALARALLRNPRFLVLDDATSSLDTQTESMIQESLQALPQTTTRIIIAHRYSSIANADRVYVLDRGHIVEEGTPRSLRQGDTQFNRVLQLEALESS